MGLFDRNMRQALSALTQKLEEIRALSADVPSQAEKYQAETENCVTAIRQLQQAVSALNAAVAGKPTEVA